MRRRLLALFVLALLVVGTLGHVRYHYGARERSRVPGDDLPGRLLAADAPGDAALWIAHPHQNLTRLALEIDDLDAYLAAVGRRLGSSSPPSLPGFGPFQLPPSRSLAVAWFDDGERFLVAADIYPTVRLLGRAAGTLAGNPWLAGGAVEVDGRPATVSWEEGVWTLATEGFAAVDVPAVRAGKREAVLAAVRLGAPRPPFPGGSYRLFREHGSHSLVLERRGAGDGPPPPAPELDLGEAGVAAFLVRGTGAPDWREPFPGPGAIAWVGGTAGTSFDLTPRAAVFELDRDLGGGGWELPRNPLSKLFDRLGSGPPSERVGPMVVEASDPETLRRAVPLASEVLRLATLERPRLVMGLWLDPGAVVEALGGASGLMDDLPFLAATDEARAVQDWEVLLAPLAGHRHVSLVVAEEPESMRLELAP